MNESNQIAQLMKAISLLSEQVTSLSTREVVHMAAIHALIEAHPSPPVVEQRFRDLIEHMLGSHDDCPPSDNQLKDQLQATNAYLASLRRPLEPGG